MLASIEYTYLKKISINNLGPRLFLNYSHNLFANIFIHFVKLLNNTKLIKFKDIRQKNKIVPLQI